MASAKSKKASSKKKATKKAAKKPAEKAAKKPVKKAAKKRPAKKVIKKTSKKAVKKKASKKKVVKKAAKKKVVKKKATQKTAKKKVAKKVAKKKATTKKATKKTAKKKVAKKPAKKAAKKKATKKPATKKASKKAAKKPAKKAAKKAPAPEPVDENLNEDGFYIPKAVEKSHGSEPIDLHHRAPSAKETRKLREVLIQRLRQLAGDVAALEDDAFTGETNESASNDPVESGAKEYNQFFTLQMIEKENSEIMQIRHALNKIDKKINLVFGKCEATGSWISIERLRAKPFARLTIRAKEKFELEGGGEEFGIYPERRY